MDDHTVTLTEVSDEPQGNTTCNNNFMIHNLITIFIKISVIIYQTGEYSETDTDTTTADTEGVRQT